MSINLTRAQRRQMQKLADRIDRVTQADRRFFERFPSRQHRVRLASQAEIEQHAVLTGYDRSPPAGYQWYVAVRNVAPGIRLRSYLIAPDDQETDVSESVALAVFETTASPKTRQIETQLRQTAEARE